MGYGQVMICGGTESSIHPLALAGFARARSVVTDSNSILIQRKLVDHLINQEMDLC